MDHDVSQFNLHLAENVGSPDVNSAYTNSLLGTLFDGRQTARVLSFAESSSTALSSSSPSAASSSSASPASSSSSLFNTAASSTSNPGNYHPIMSSPSKMVSSLRTVYTQNKLQRSLNEGQPKYPHISPTPEKILDAPDLLDDYYLNLLDWGSRSLLAVALGQSVYIWNASNGAVSELMSTEDETNYISSVSWSDDGCYIAIGTGGNEVQIWDVEASRLTRRLLGHEARVASLSWNGHLLSSGSRDSTIINHDTRISNHVQSVLEGHQQEVCGLKWSPNGSQLASGGNDNVLNIWEFGYTHEPRYQLNQHQAAVKALSWCPWQSNLLASGGGTADRMLRFWNTSTGNCINSIDTKSQVCSIQWSRNDRKLVTSHGFSQNQLIVWRYPSLTKMAELTGHSSRVLHLARSPDGSTVVSAAGDETLRFWRVFSAPPISKKKKSQRGTTALGQSVRIR